MNTCVHTYLHIIHIVCSVRHAYVRMYMCVYLSVWMCRYVRIYVSMYHNIACMHMYMHVCMHIFIVFVHTCTYVHSQCCTRHALCFVGCRDAVSTVQMDSGDPYRAMQKKVQYMKEHNDRAMNRHAHTINYKINREQQQSHLLHHQHYGQSGGVKPTGPPATRGTPTDVGNGGAGAYEQESRDGKEQTVSCEVPARQHVYTRTQHTRACAYGCVYPPKHTHFCVVSTCEK